MPSIGYTAMCEQTPTRQLVSDLASAEEAGFDFAVVSGHYFPWLEEQGHSANAWLVLGAAAQATWQLPLMTFVTCPSFRYHPAVIAQQAATLGVLSDGRFTLGLGAGENPNEHAVGQDRPSARVRHERLREAAHIIRELFTGGYVNYSGTHFRVDRAKLYDRPEHPVPIAIAASGPSSAQIAAEYGDGMIATQADARLSRAFRASAGPDKPVYGQLALSYDPDETAAVDRAARLLGWAATGWRVMSELPEPQAFEAISRLVTATEIGRIVPCGPDTSRHVAAVRRYLEAGFTHVALVQIGADTQEAFIAWAADELLPALRDLAVSTPNGQAEFQNPPDGQN